MWNFKWTLLFLSYCCLAQAQSQRQLSLKECKQLAITNNMALQRGAINIKSAQQDTKLQKRARLPQVSFSTRSKIQFGRTIDLSQNTFINENIGNIAFSANVQMPVYAGGRIRNNIKKAVIQEEITTLEQKELINNTILEVTRLYYEILQFQEQVQIARKQARQTKQQLVAIDKQIEAGKLPRSERLNILVNQADIEQQLIEFENAITIGYGELHFLLQIDIDTPFELLQVDINEAIITTKRHTISTLYEQALQVSPQLEIIELNQAILELDTRILKADGLPSLDLQSWAGSSFSEYLQASQSTGVSFIDQVQENFGRDISLNLRIPLFMKGQLKLGVEQLQLTAINQQLAFEETKQTLRLDINRSLNQLQLAEQTLKVAKRREEQAAILNKNAKILFENGAINALDLVNFQNLQQQAASEVVRAKYNYLYQVEELEIFTQNNLH